MKPSVYIETTVVSYLTSRTSRDVIVAGRQALTSEWWDTCQERFEIFVSPLVVEEAREGDPRAARRRMAAIAGVPAVAATDEALHVSQLLIQSGPMPKQYPEDALHIGICAANGIDYLVTWNCTHLANAVLRRQIERLLMDAGYQCPIICTPEELMEG